MDGTSASMDDFVLACNASFDSFLQAKRDSCLKRRCLRRFRRADRPPTGRRLGADHAPTSHRFAPTTWSRNATTIAPVRLVTSLAIAMTHAQAVPVERVRHYVAGRKQCSE